MRILIIGGTGFIGAHIVRAIADQDHAVAIYHRGRTQVALPELFAFAPDVVIHTVAMGSDDAQASVQAFSGRAGRLVMLSSGDVYRAYGRFTKIEPGPTEEGLLSEDAPLRTILYPYRAQASSPEKLQYWYEKILAERAVLSDPNLLGTVLRLPKVYGPWGNDDLATVYKHGNHPDWRWTHGSVENVAAAIVLAATHPSAGDRVYNVGELYTPTMGERLAWLPPSTIPPDQSGHFDFTQNLAYDTSKIRIELGYRELVTEEEGALRTLSRDN
jgi:nucleoside-diphosphate-sugar epimerase